MPRKQPRVYWDASVFLALFQKGDTEDRKYQREQSILLLEEVRRNNGFVITSAFTLAESRRGDDVPPLPGKDYATPKAFFKHSFIEVVPVDRAIGELAADYGERFGLKPGDAVQLATAVRAGADLFLAWDGHFHENDRLADAPIHIEKPKWTGQPTMPLFEDSVIDPAGEPPQIPAPETAAPSVDGKHAASQAERLVTEGTEEQPKTMHPAAASPPAEAAEGTIGDKETPSRD